MDKKALSIAIATAMGVAIASVGQAHTTPAPSTMEQCVPVDQNGKNLVKAHKTDCNATDSTGKHSCAGQNAANEEGAWILVPAGVCDKIKAGDWKEVPANICERLDACTQ